MSQEQSHLTVCDCVMTELMYPEATGCYLPFFNLSKIQELCFDIKCLNIKLASQHLHV